jgi:hypothetical protein
MQWITLTANDVLSTITTTELDKFSKSVVGGAVPDRIVPILADMVSEIRGYIASCEPNSLSATAATIPPSFKARALAVIRWRLLVTIPGYEPGDARKLEYEKAEAFFSQVAQCKIRPEAADDAVPTTAPSAHPSGIEVVSAPPKRTGRTNMNGL